MDFLRSSIKVLFHDISPSDVMEIIDNRLDDGDFFDRIGELLSHRERSFSGRELEGLHDVLDSDWLGDIDGLPSFRKKLYSPPERIFTILAEFGAESLNLHQGTPRVKFNQLLRWTDLTRYVEENLLSIPHIAVSDIKGGKPRSGFCWPNVLDHDNANINGILENGVSDIHCHLYASTDVFEFNWLTAMNHPETISSLCTSLQSKGGKGLDFLRKGRLLMYDGVSRFSSFHFSLADWMLMAAYLRIFIYSNLIGESEIPWRMTTGMLRDITEDANSVINEVRAIRSWLAATGKGLLTSNGNFLDYLISKETGVGKVTDGELKSPFMIHHGERWLLHEFLTRYFCSDDRRLRKAAPFLWLYLLIRSKIRREFVQVNSLVGFDNFQRYQGRKAYFPSEMQSVRLNEVALCYAVQSALAKHPRNKLEGRISPGQAKSMVRVKFWMSIFGKDRVLSEEDMSRFSLVVHFLKRQPPRRIADGANRYAALWKNYDADMCHIIRHQRWQTEMIENGIMNGNKPRFVGIDAASSELGCRPEVFSEYFKRAHDYGIHNFTFHAGEDFFDILDGMRTIDETIRFLGFSYGCRIGHGLALATNPHKYYAERHGTMILPAQELLDNLVWMKYKGDLLDVRFHSSTEAFLRNKVSTLLDKLNYGKVNPQDYCRALWHRCDSAELLKRQTSNVVNIISDYYYSPGVIAAGNETEHVTWLPPQWSEDVEMLQEAILTEFESKGIVVECNPTSNLRIGRFEKYSLHPVFKFHGVRYDRNHSIPVAINTDDRGVFATSLRNEYSLIAAALYKETNDDGKKKYSDREIEEYIETLAKYGNRSLFRI